MIKEIKFTDKALKQIDNLLSKKDKGSFFRIAIKGGSEVDYVSELIGEQFKISNPQTKSSCGCGVSFSL